MKTPILLLTVVFLSRAAAADEVYLKGGGRLSGRIVSHTDTSIEVDVGAGRLAVPTSSVLRIEEGRSPLHEYGERASRLAASDVEGWIALGAWASASGLSSQAREAYQRALAVAPNDPRANTGLGNVKIDGRWVSEDEGYRMRGYVQYQGDWITPAEHEAILRERAADDARASERREAERRVQEAETRAQEAEARAKEAEARQTEGGFPLSYAWGGGPAVWPTGPIVVPPISTTWPGSVPR
jgi:hypothetical protein